MSRIGILPELWHQLTTLPSSVSENSVRFQENGATNSLQPDSNGLQPTNDGLPPKSDGLQPASDGLQRKTFRFMCSEPGPSTRDAMESA